MLAGTVAMLAAVDVAWADDGRLAAPDAHAKAREGDLLILDVRSEREWRATGLARGAEPVTIHDPRGKAGFLDAVARATGGDRSRAIATICATGVRSTRAQAWLIEAGYTAVANVKEGMLGRHDEHGPQPGWLRRSLPVKPYVE